MPIVGPTTDHTAIRRWADSNHAVPIEVLPHEVDSEPALLRFMIAEQAKDHSDVRLIAWEDFFVKFDCLGLSFVYDDDSTGYNELLQVEERSPYNQSGQDAASSEN
jgi:hypothetical protein